MVKVAKKRKTFVDVLFEKRRGMVRLENAGAASLRRQMRRIKRDSLKLIERNMGTFRRTGEYIDSPSALMTAKRTATEMDILLQQRLAGPTNDVIRLRQTAWDQGVIDLKGASRRLPQDIQASMNASFGQVNLQAAVAARTNPLFGIAPRAAFNGIRGHTTKRVQELLSSAVLSSASVKETAQQLADAMDLNVAAAQRIVRTNMNAAYNEAHRAIYNANPEIFSGYRWEAVFDDRTSVICLELHGSFYPLGTVPPGPPAHWNCRSILVGVFRDQDIEKVVEDTPRRVREFKELPDGTFKSITKTVAGDLRASDWLKSQPFGIVQDVTGSRLKAEFFLQGTASLDDIVTPGLRIRNNRAFMKRMAALHPNNKRYQKMAHELGVKRVPKVDSVRRGDAATASKQPFDQPVPDPSTFAEEAVQGRVRTLLPEEADEVLRKRGLTGTKTLAGRGQGGKVFTYSDNENLVVKIARPETREAEAALRIKDLKKGHARVVDAFRVGDEDWIIREAIDIRIGSTLEQVAIEALDEVSGTYGKYYGKWGSGRNVVDDLLIKYKPGTSMHKMLAAHQDEIADLVDFWQDAHRRGVMFVDIQQGQFGLVRGRVAWFDYGNAEFIEEVDLAGAALKKVAPRRLIKWADDLAVTNKEMITKQTTIRQLQKKLRDAPANLKATYTRQISEAKKDYVRLRNKKWRIGKRIKEAGGPGPQPPPKPVTFRKATPRQKFDTGVTDVEETNRRIVELRSKVSPSLEEVQELKALQAVRTREMNKLRALRRADPTLPELPESTRLPKGIGVKPRPTVGAPERRRIQFSPEVQKLKTQVDELDVEWNKLTQKLRPLDRETAALQSQRFRLRLANQTDTARYRGITNRLTKSNRELNELRDQVEEVRDRLLTAHQKFNKAATVERAEVLAKIRTPKFVSKADNAIARAKAELDSLGYDLATLRHQSSNPTELLDLLNSVHGQGAGVKLTPTRQAIWDNIKKEMQSLKQWNTTKGQQWKQLLGAMDESLLQDSKLESIYFQLSRERRAFANRFVNNIGIKKGEQMRTLAHEFGHHLQYRNPKLKSRTLQWQRARTKDDALTTIYKGTKERGKKDKFYGHYVGRVYQDGFQEGVSMGLQTFMDRRGSWRQIVKTDPDHMYLMWAMLRGY